VFTAIMALVLSAGCEEARRVPTPGGGGSRDAGSRSDSGQTASDASDPAHDSGLPANTDSGFPSNDSGPGGDAGFPSTDAGSPGFDGGFPSADAGFPSTDAGFPSTDAGFPSTDAGFLSFPSCLQACSTPADCALGAPGYGAANYQCDRGGCVWIGCLSEADCSSIAGTTCVATAGTTLRTCQKRCSTPSDCGSSTPAYDADNYACTSGICEYRGCNSTAECAATISDPRIQCGRLPSWSFSACQYGCSTAADCAMPGAGPAFDADNYRCTSGICEFIGCHTSQECTSSFGNRPYVCHTP
jgi:hypothetical protein